jgi:hypothetical protein
MTGAFVMPARTTTHAATHTTKKRQPQHTTIRVVLTHRKSSFSWWEIFCGFNPSAATTQRACSSPPAAPKNSFVEK